MKFMLLTSIIIVPQCITSGDYCFSFGSHGDGPATFFPWGVAVTPDNSSVVADGVGHWVQLFHLDGTIIHKFGTQGNRGGELYWPSSITVDDNSYIVVMDD